jgi:hypothetical protein
VTTSLQGWGGAVYFDDGEFEAQNCCLSHCDADRGPGFYLLSHQSASYAKIGYSTFIQCSDKPGTANTAAVAAVNVLFEVENLNFSECMVDGEGTAFSVERQGSRLRFVSGEYSNCGATSVIDFDTAHGDPQAETTIVNSRFLHNDIGLPLYHGTVYSSGGTIRCDNCYFIGNNHDLDASSGGRIIVENCYFSSSLSSYDWLTTINCKSNFGGTAPGLCIPAIGVCSQVQICTTQKFVASTSFPVSDVIPSTAALPPSSQGIESGLTELSDEFKSSFVCDQSVPLPCSANISESTTSELALFLPSSVVSTDDFADTTNLSVSIGPEKSANLLTHLAFNSSNSFLSCRYNNIADSASIPISYNIPDSLSHRGSIYLRSSASLEGTNSINESSLFDNSYIFDFTLHKHVSPDYSDSPRGTTSAVVSYSFIGFPFSNGFDESQG